jgi:NitT/TauT family transport system ATP-binding protein
MYSSNEITIAVPDATSAYVSLSKVGKTYASSRGPVSALADISLDIRPHEFVSVVGPSGCGKSTLLKLVAGLEGVSAGSVRVAGRTLGGPPDRLGVVFQRDVLFDWRTVLDNVLLSIEFTRKPTSAERDRAKALLKRFGLFGPPGIILFNAGKEIPNSRVIGFLAPEPFVEHLTRHIAS